MFIIIATTYVIEPNNICQFVSNLENPRQFDLEVPSSVAVNLVLKQQNDGWP